MTLPYVGSLQAQGLGVERRGSGYSTYAVLTVEEQYALTRVDAINIGIGVQKLMGKLKQEEETLLSEEKNSILESPAWNSAVHKLAENHRLMETIKRNRKVSNP